MHEHRILQTGRNCWRIRRAARVAFLIDGDAYFSALHDALQRAEQDIMILSWDVYSELKLGALQGDDRSLATLLNDCLEARPHLKAHILNWDFSMIFAMDREWLPAYKLGWQTHPRLTFQLDSRHPVGASHHQKLIVLDNRLAFAGGLDLTRGRWDTPEHRANDPRRKQIDGTLGRPYHDVQVAVQGEAAAALNDLARERWRCAVDRGLPEAADTDAALWPAGVPVDLEDVAVAISRTEPAYRDHAEVREVEQLYLDAIAAAQDYIYIENQYFTCPGISRALARRLAEDHGPQVIIVMPLATEGWLAQNSMDVIRIKLLQELREADHASRFAAYYPHKHDLASSPINVHAKLMLVDDRFVRVGSSNLNNRSMGLDTECDIAIECRADEERITQGIRAFRNRLLGEHLGIEGEQVQRAVEEHGALLPAIKAHVNEDRPRTLLPLLDKLPKYTDSVLTESELVDPEQPVNIDALVYHALPEQDTTHGARRIIVWVIGLLALLGLAAAWRYTPLGDWLDIESITGTLENLGRHTFAPVLLVLAFVVAAVLMVPVTLLIIASVIVFGPWLGFTYALTGAVASAMLGYALGSYLGRDTIRSLARGRISRISQQLARRGMFTIVVVRIVPVAPFTIINLMAGASHIKLRDFFWGTLLGLIPGVTAVAILTDRVQATLADPQPEAILLLAGIAALILGASYFLSRYLLRLRES